MLKGIGRRASGSWDHLGRGVTSAGIKLWRHQHSHLSVHTGRGREEGSYFKHCISTESLRGIGTQITGHTDLSAIHKPKERLGSDFINEEN